MKKVAITIPCYYSKKNIVNVVNEIHDVFKDKEEYDLLVFCINDGSTDETFDYITELSQQYDFVSGFDLSKNYGQATGRLVPLSYIDDIDYLIYMDDDGQHDPQDIFRLIEKVDEGYDVVYANFPDKAHSFMKKLASNINTAIMHYSVGKPKDVHLSSFYAINGMMVEAIKSYKSPFPTMLGYIMQVTNKITNIDAVHRSRIEGHSGYNLKKMIRLWMDGFVNFSIVPLRISSFVGVAVAVIGFVSALFMICKKLFIGGVANGFTMMFSAFMIIGGFILVSLGLIGEYLGRIYLTISDMPQFNVRRKVIAKKLEGKL